MRKIVAVVAAAAAAMLLGAAPASADPVPPGCERVPILGLDPHVRTICDMPIQPDGSWTRFRGEWWIGGQQSTCGGRNYPGGNCPPWLEHDWMPDRRSPVAEYTVTWDTIPPGEPGHVDGA